MSNNNYKGYSLFKDVEEKELRVFNRARILANIAEQYTKDEKITPRGAGLIMGYFSQIAVDERKEIILVFTELMQKQGFQLMTQEVEHAS